MSDNRDDILPGVEPIHRPPYRLAELAGYTAGTSIRFLVSAETLPNADRDFECGIEIVPNRTDDLQEGLIARRLMHSANVLADISDARLAVLAGSGKTPEVALALAVLAGQDVTGILIDLLQEQNDLMATIRDRLRIALDAMRRGNPKLAEDLLLSLLGRAETAG